MNIDPNGHVSIYADCAALIQAKPNQVRPDPYDVAKCCLTNLKMACNALIRGRLSTLDPIVGENACQIRALAALRAYDNPIQIQEAERIAALVEERLKHLIYLMNKERNRAFPFYNRESSLGDQLKSLELEVEVSQELDYLVRSHFLTVGKYFFVNRHGVEKSGIDIQRIKQVLKTSLRGDFLEVLINYSQQKLSQLTISLIQMEAEKLSRGGDSGELNRIKNQLQPPRIRTVGPCRLQASCAFYNMKAVVLRVCELQLPILIKEHQASKPKGYYLRSEIPGASPSLSKRPEEAHQAMLVIEGYFAENEPQEGIAIALQSKLIDLILANVALVKQYSEDDDLSVLEEGAKDEVARYRDLGKQLGCQTHKPHLFSIVHVHAGTAGEEKGI